MALPEDFSKIYGSTATGGLTPISDVNYAKGWEFVGSNPPTKNDFSYLQNLSDQKSQWLYNNKLQRTDPFGDIKEDGASAIAAALSNLGLGEAAKRAVGTGQDQIPDMSSFTFTGTVAGWVAKGPGKLIVQGGITGSIVSAPWDVGIAFPTPFPSQVLAIFPFNLIPPGGSECVLWAFNSPNLLGANVRAIGVTSQNSATLLAPYSGLTCGWLAIGV